MVWPAERKSAAQIPHAAERAPAQSQMHRAAIDQRTFHFIKVGAAVVDERNLAPDANCMCSNANEGAFQADVADNVNKKRLAAFDFVIKFLPYIHSALMHADLIGFSLLPVPLARSVHTQNSAVFFRFNRLSAAIYCITFFVQTTLASKKYINFKYISIFLLYFQSVIETF